MADTALTVISTMSPSAATLSAINPAGIKVEGWMFRFMLLIALVNQHQANRQCHQK